VRAASILAALVAMAGLQNPGPAPNPIDLTVHVPALRQNLESAVISVWYPASIDKQRGGYAIASDGTRRLVPTRERMIVTQARMLWLSARLAREGYGGPEMVQAARHGYAFLRDRMWDATHGGFYWEVDAGDGRIVQARKHLYAQAFGLYALSEYFLATADRSALDLAGELVATIERHAHDDRYGGYREYFERDWSEVPSGQPSPIGGTAGMKLMNTHLHLMEAFATYFRASKLPLARTRLEELIGIQSKAVVRKELPACTDRYGQDWTPILDEVAARVSYGHDLENIWLLADALEAVGRSPAELLDLYKGLFAYSMRHGFDEEKGGFFESGPLGQPADRRNKIWWVQAEALVSALTMYRLTGDGSYARVFERTWRFVNATQTDWEAGEWHELIRPDGSFAGRKASAWKAGYHNGRALLESLRAIRLHGSGGR
jgi:mannobiose 2-epimerase